MGLAVLNALLQVSGLSKKDIGLDAHFEKLGFGHVEWGNMLTALADRFSSVDASLVKVLPTLRHLIEHVRANEAS